jgi:hypothetical protein
MIIIIYRIQIDLVAIKSLFSLIMKEVTIQFQWVTFITI